MESIELDPTKEIVYFEWFNRTIGLFEAGKVVRVGDLLLLDEQELHKILCGNKRAIKEVHDFLKVREWSLNMEHPALDAYRSSKK